MSFFGLMHTYWNALRLVFNPYKLRAMNAPQNVDEAINGVYYLCSTMPEKTRLKLAKISTPERFAFHMKKLFGDKLINQWRLFDSGSPVHEDFKTRFEITETTYMVEVLFKCAWQRLNGHEPLPNFYAETYTRAQRRATRFYEENKDEIELSIEEVREKYLKGRLP